MYGVVDASLLRNKPSAGDLGLHWNYCDSLKREGQK